MDGGVILKSKPDQFIMDEWSCMTKTAAQNLKGDCPMLEDAVLSDMAKYIKELEEQNKKLTEISIGLLEWIDAVPTNTQLPAMPRIDRDYVDRVLNTGGLNG